MSSAAENGIGTFALRCCLLRRDVGLRSCWSACERTQTVNPLEHDRTCPTSKCPLGPGLGANSIPPFCDGHHTRLTLIRYCTARDILSAEIRWGDYDEDKYLSEDSRNS